MFKGTTVVAVKGNNGVAIGGDGQVTFGETTIMKHGAKKIRRLYQGKVLAGFAGSVADAFTLFSLFESKLEQYQGNLQRAAVELAQDWRKDKMLQRLEAMLLVADTENLLLISGNGEVIEPDENVLAIGSGGSYAFAAATALVRHSDMMPKEIVQEALKIASSICVYTNDHITIEELNGGDDK